MHVFRMYFPCISHPKTTATANNSPPAQKSKWTTAKGAIAKGKTSATPALDATTDERGIVFAAQKLVNIAPEHQALNSCKYTYLKKYFILYVYNNHLF